MESLQESDRQCSHTARLILESGQIDPEEKNHSGKIPFDIAAEGGARRIGALLSGQDPEIDGLAGLIGGLDIFQALWNKDEAALDALLRSGTDMQILCEDEKMYDFYGKSPLGCALIWDEFLVVRKCCSGAVSTRISKIRKNGLHLPCG